MQTNRQPIDMTKRFKAGCNFRVLCNRRAKSSVLCTTSLEDSGNDGVSVLIRLVLDQAVLQSLERPEDQQRYRCDISIAVAHTETSVRASLPQRILGGFGHCFKDSHHYKASLHIPALARTFPVEKVCLIFETEDQASFMCRSSSPAALAVSNRRCHKQMDVIRLAQTQCQR